MMTNANTTASPANRLRAALKDAGYNARAVSVRHDHYSMGSSIYVTIRRAGVARTAVESVADAFEDVSRDASGEILSGGNTYVTVEYDRDLVRDFAATVRANLEMIPDGGWLEIRTDIPVSAPVTAPDHYEVQISADGLVDVFGLGHRLHPARREVVADQIARTLLGLGVERVRSIGNLVAAPSTVVAAPAPVDQAPTFPEMMRPVPVADPADWAWTLNLSI